jgi:outer membrane protein, heavy metal efflux system
MLRVWNTYAALAWLVMALSMVDAAWSQGRSLTLGEARQLALQRNLELAVERKETAIAKAGLTRAKTYAFNPELDVEPGGGRSREIVGGGAATIYNVNVGVSQVMELKGQRRLRTQRAAATLEQTDWVIRDAERRVRADVSRSFTEVLVAQDRVQFAREFVALNQQLLGAAKELLKAGEAPRIDVLRAEVEVRKARNELTVAERELAAAKKELQLLIGQPPSFEFQAGGPLLYRLRDITLEPASVLALAFAHRPDLKAAETGLQGAEAGIALARAERLFPTLRISARYEQARESDSRNQRGVVSFSVPLPLLNRNQGELETALAEHAQQAAKLDQVKAAFAKDVSQALDRVLFSRQIVEPFTSAILPQQQKNFELIREGYRSGQFNLTETLIAQREFVESRLRYLEAVLEFNRALTELEEAVGTGFIEAGEGP